MQPESLHAPYRKRCKRWNIPGQGHCLTFSCFRRQPFLARERVRCWLAEALVAAREKHNFRVIAWVFMPEHAHLLLWPREQEYSVSKMLSSIKLPVAIKSRGFVLKHAPGLLPRMLDQQPNGSRAFRIWQRGGGYGRNIYSPEELWEKIQYIHNNPVRRKLAARATEWEWSSAADYAHCRIGPPPIPVDNDNLPWPSG